MNKAQLKQLIKDEIIKHYFGLGLRSEDMVPTEKPEDEEEDQLQPQPTGSLNPNPEQPDETEPEQEPQIQQPQVQQVTRVEAVDLIMGTRGKVFTTLFTKKDGTERLMNCRLGVKKYLKGGSLRFNPEERGLLPVFDMQKRAYRMINFKTMKLVKLGKQTYDITG